MMAVGLFFFASATHVATTCRHPALQSKNKRHARHGAERGSNQNPDLSRIQQRSAERLGDILSIVRASGALAFTQEAARREAQLALDCLDGLFPNPYVEALRALTEYSTSRLF